MKAARRFRRPVPSPALIAKAAKAEPPPRFPRGYFDPLMPVVHKLLDNRYKLHQVADWCIHHGSLQPQHRRRFMDAMKMRFSRLRRANEGELTNITWKSSLFYNSVHAVGDSGKALCGTTASQWAVHHGGGAQYCTRCKGIVTKRKVTVLGDN